MKIKIPFIIYQKLSQRLLGMPFFEKDYKSENKLWVSLAEHGSVGNAKPPIFGNTNSNFSIANILIPSEVSNDVQKSKKNTDERIIEIDDGERYEFTPPEQSNKLQKNAPYKNNTITMSKIMKNFSNFTEAIIKSVKQKPAEGWFAFLNGLFIERNRSNSSNGLRNTFVSAMMLVLLTTFSSIAQVVDLNLTQSIDNSKPAINGIVTYKITLKNEGMVPVTGVVVRDIFPAGGATLTSNTPSAGTTFTTSSGLWNVPSLNVGQSVVLELKGKVVAQGVWFNTAEVISMASGLEDTDSDPGNGALNEDDYASSCFSVPIEWSPGDAYTVSIAASGITAITWSKISSTGSKAITGAPTDSATVTGDVLTVTGTGRFAFTAKATTCPATGCCELIVVPAKIFDLALTKDLVSTGTFKPGDNVTFKLTVKNEGNVAAAAIVLRDSLMAGFTLADANWTVGANNVATLNTPIAGPLAPGATASVNITVKIDAGFKGSKLTNYAEIKSGNPVDGTGTIIKDPSGNPIKDIDSTPNNSTRGNEDDDDSKEIPVEQPAPVFDLALTKDLVSTGTFKPGDNVTFKLTVKNEGNVAAAAIVLRDSLMAGFTLADANWTVGADNVATLNTPIAGPLAPGATASVNITVKIDANFTGTKLTNYAEIKSGNPVDGTGTIIKDPSGNPIKDIDSKPNNGTRGNEDDDDDESINVGRPICAIPPTPTCAGTIMNECPRECVDLTKYILSEIRTQGGKFEWRTGPKTTDPLVADPTKVCTSGKYFLFEKADCGEYSNPALAEVVIKECPTADLSLDKVVNNKTPKTGDDITYTIKITNGGPAIATNVEATDKLPAGISYVSGGTSVTYAAGVVTMKAASIAVGANASFTFVAKVAATSGTIKNWAEVSKSDQKDPDSTPGNGTDKNEDDDDDEDITVKEPCAIPPTPTCAGTVHNVCPSLCVNLNDHILSSVRTVGGKFEWHSGSTPTDANLVADPTKVCASGKYFLFEKAACGEYSNGALIEVGIKECQPQVADLSLTKTINTATSYKIGDVVTYTITVKNAGPDAATNIEISDKIPTSLSYQTGGTGVTHAAGLVTAKVASIASGGTAIFTYTAKIMEAGTIANAAEVSKSDQKDPDSTPGNGVSKNEDDDDVVTIEAKDPNCAIPPTPTCGGPRVVPCPANGCININEFIQSAIRTPGGIHEWHTSPDPTSPKVADPTCVKTSGSYYVFEKAKCGEYSNAALLMLTIEPCRDKIDVSLTMAISNPTPAVGEEVTYTIVVRNDGPGVATDVKVGSLLPAGIQFVSSTDFTASGSNLTSNNIPTIPAAGSVTLTFKGKVTVEGSLTTKAQVIAHKETDIDSTPNNGYDNTEDDRASITLKTATCLPINAPVLSCAKPNICVGESATITSTGCDGVLTWSNGATGASITVSPNATTGYTATCDKAACKSPASNTITINVATPTVPTITASKNTTCVGGSVTLTAASCTGTVVWSTGASGVQIVVIPTSTTTYTAKCKIGDCESGISNGQTITIGSPEAPVITATKTLLCASESVTLTATGCEGGQVVWPSGAIATSITVSPAATTDYTAKCKVGDCISANSNTVKVTVSTSGSAPTLTASKSGICVGESVTLTAAGCEGTVSWSTNTTGGSITVMPTTTTTYTASCKNGSGKCDSAPASVTVSVGNPASAPSIVASPSNTSCAGAPVTLTASGCTGGMIVWSTGATGASITTTPTTNTTYTAKCKIGECESPAASAAITVLPAIQKPLVTCSANEICPGQSLTLEVKNCAGTVMWSTGATGAVAIVVSPTVTTTYTAKCKVGNCESETSNNYTITVTPVATPTVSASATSITTGQSVTLTASGCDGEVIWDNGMSGAQIIVSPTASTSYKATCKKGSCMSSMSMAVTVTVGGTKPVIVVNPDATTTQQNTTVNIAVLGNDKAPNGSAADLTNVTLPVIVTGPTNGTVTVKADGTIDYKPNTGFSGIDTFTYKICDKNDATNCATATVTISVLSPQPCTTPSATPTVSASATSITAGQTVTLTAAGCVGGTVTWNNTMSGSSITVSPTATTSYTATCKVGDCPASPASAAVTVTVNPSEPNPQPVFDLSLTKKLAAGQSATVSVGDIVNYVITVKNEGTVTATQVNVKDKLPAGLQAADANWANVTANEYRLINAIPSIPAGTSVDVNIKMQVLSGATGSLTNNAQIYTAKDADGNTATDKDSSPNNGYDNGEDDESLATITVGTTPPNPTACNAPVISGSQTLCAGGSATLTATACNGTVQWSNGSSGASITVSPTSTTSYTAVCKCSDNGTSAVSNSVTVTIGNPNAPTIACNSPFVCKGGATTLTATGCDGTVTWSNGSTGASITVTLDATTSFKAKCKVGNCESPESTNCVVTVGMPAAPTVSTNNSKICFGQPVTLTATGTCAGYFIWSNGLVGNSITITPAATANYTAVCCTNENCKSALSNSVSVEVGSKIVPPQTMNLANNCPFTTVDLTKGVTSATPSGAAVEFHVSNSATSALVANPTAVSTSGTYYAFYKNANCMSDGSPIVVLVTTCSNTSDCQANPATADAGASASICAAFSYKLTGKIGGSATGATWTTDGTGTFDNANSLSATYLPSIADLVKGNVKLTLTTNDPDGADGACKAGVSTMTLTFDGIKFRPQIAINGTMKADTNKASMTICSGGVVTLSATETGYEYKWFKDGQVVASASSKNAYEVTEPGTYYYQLVDAKRCCSVYSAWITVSTPASAAPQNLIASNTCPATTIDLTKVQGMANMVFHTGSTSNSPTVLNPNQVSAGTYYAFMNSGTCQALVAKIEAKVESCTSTTTPPDTSDLSIGIALAVTDVVKQDNGSYNVTYTITVKNTGNAPLTNVQITDQITKGITAPATYSIVSVTTPTGSTITPNPGFNGTSDKNILNAGASTLEVGATQTVNVVVNINPNGNNGPFSGGVTGSGTNGSKTVEDKSNNGTVVNKPENTTTPVRFDLPTSLMGIAKSAGTVQNLGGGKYKIPYTIKVTNLGSTTLTNIQVADDLTKTFGTLATVVGKPKVTADSGFVVDTMYTGQGMLINLLKANLSSLDKGKSKSINLEITIMSSGADSTTKFNNIAIGSALAGTIAVKDTSTSGTNVDPDNDLDPRNNSTPTPVVLSSVPARNLIGSALSIKDTVMQADGSYNITYRVKVKNFGTGVMSNVQLKDSLSTVFNSTTGAEFKIVRTPIASDSSTLRINPDFNGTTDVNLLIAEQSRLSAGRMDSVFFTVNVKTDGRQTPYLNRVCARAIAGKDTLMDLSMNGLNPDPNGNNNPTESTEQEFTPVIIPVQGGELYVPEGFSPNGDGINDLFVIRHPAGTTVKVEIYNRWMHLVYRMENYQNDWNGDSNVGTQLGSSTGGLPVGTYYYNVILVGANGEETKRACRFMTINR